MTTTYSEFANKTASKKITLVHLDMKREVKVFSTSGTTHTRAEDFFVTNVELNGSFTEGFTFTFDPSIKSLSITFDGDIAAQEVIVTYRLFLAEYDIITSNDLGTGVDVEYLGLVKSTPGFATSLNFATGNKTVIGNGSLTLDNSNGFFNEILQRYRLENKEFSAYSWSPDIPIDSHKLIYRGVTNRANLNQDSLRLDIRDSLYNLNNTLNLTKFTTNEVIERDSSRFKKSIFGRVNGMGIQSIDQNGDGFAGTGILSSVSGTTFITGIGTSFLSELAPRDTVTANNITVTVRKVVDDEFFLVAAPLTASLAGAFTVSPSRQFNNKNRIFSIANHAIKKFSTTLAGFVDERRLRVIDATGFVAGDTVIILNEEYVIDAISKVYTDAPANTISQDVIRLERTLSSNNRPIIGDLIETKEVANVAFGNDLFVDASVTVNNADNTETTITLADDTEQRIARDGFLENTLTTVANTPYYVLGVPAIQNITLTGTPTNLRGSYFQFAKIEDTATLSGEFVLFSTSTPIRQFLTNVAATVQFVAGDIYQVTDGTNKDDFFFVRTSGINMNHVNIGKNLPIRVNLDAQSAISYDLASLALRRTLAESRTEQLFAFDSPMTSSVNWTLLGNKGALGITNTFVLGTNTGSTISNNEFNEGIATNIDESIAENVKTRDLISVQGESESKFVVDSQSSFVEVSMDSQTTRSGTGIFRNPTYITDRSLITCSAFGQTLDGTITGPFTGTAAEAVRTLLTINGLSEFLNTTTFIDSAANEPLIIGIYAPYNLRSQPPSVLDLVNRITISTLGSIGLDENFLFKFQLLNGFKPESLDNIRRIDNNEIRNTASETITASPIFRYTLRNIDASYDLGEADPTSKLVRLENPRIGRLTDLDTSESVDLYLRKEADATAIADRYLNYSQRFNRIVSFQGALSLENISIGDVVLLDIIEIKNRQRNNIPFIGMVTSFVRNGQYINLNVDDFGGLFLRSATLNNDLATTFATSGETGRLLGTFLTDDNGIIDNDEDTFGFNVLP